MAERKRRFAAVLVCSMVVAACSDPAGPPRIEDTTFAPQLGVNLSAMTKTPSGLYIQDLTLGTGTEAGGNSTVRAYYTGWLVDGTEFDGRQPPAEPQQFPLGGVIRGFGEGVRGMRVGGSRLIVIPSRLGYGEGGSPPDIPGNAILVFKVDLVAVL